MGLTLAIETTGAACSVALIDGDAVVDERHEAVGRGHAERLMPMIGDLLGGRRPDYILVDCGPGSFTGVRVGLAAAKGLALGWRIAAAGYSATALLACTAFRHHLADEIAIAISGGHGQLFVERFARAPFRSIETVQSLYPAEAAALCAHSDMVAGSGAEAVIAAGAGHAQPVAVEMRAAGVRWLEPAYRSLAALPIYGRAPDAKPQKTVIA